MAKLYATWAQTVFTELLFVLILAFLAMEFKTTGSMEYLESLVITSLIGFFISLFLVLSSMKKVPIMVSK